MNIDIRKIIKNRKIRGKIMYGLSFLPDSVYISLFYKATTGEWPNLRHPSGYNEKLQWLKIHDRHPEYRNYVDKLRVRKIIKKKIGKTYLFPLLGHWDCFDDIEFDTVTGNVTSIIIFGRPRAFGLMGRDDDIIIKCEDIEVIGEDTILVRFESSAICTKSRSITVENLSRRFHENS